MWVRSLGREDPLEEGIAIQYSCLVNPYGQRGLAGHSPQGRKESDTLKGFSTHIALQVLQTLIPQASGAPHSCTSGSQEQPIGQVIETRDCNSGQKVYQEKEKCFQIVRVIRKQNKNS